MLDQIERTTLGALLGIMVLVTFVNVVLRYVFRDSLIWGLEVTAILFAWLVLLGMSHGIKHSAHLGIDVVVNSVGRRLRKLCGLVAAGLCLLYALLMLKGAWDYWAPFASLSPTEGRWLPVGLDLSARSRAFYMTDQVPMPGALRFLEDWINEGERFSYLPRAVPYAAIPLAFGLLTWRCGLLLKDVTIEKRDRIIANHEIEDDVEA